MMQPTNCTIKKYLSIGLCLLLLICFTQISCKKEPRKIDFPAGSNEYVNNWILDSMKVYYYWNNSLPAKPNLSLAPSAFFTSILKQEDRFSRLINPTISSSYYPSLVHNFGFDLAVYQESTGAVKTVVTLVVPQSQVAIGGLQRGSFIKSINGSSPTATSITGLIISAIQQRKIELEIEGGGKLSIGASIISENPVYLYKTFNVGAKTVGYLFYNSFEARSKYKLQEAFNFFKAQQATELIVDMRYNAGGDIGMSAALATVLSQVNKTDIFVEYRGNSNAGVIRESFDSVIAKMASGYNLTFNEMISLRLSLNKVYILTGNHTASAAEFLIKGLRPWQNVIQIGATTLGKDMASFGITDGNKAKNNAWVIEPMIFKLYNSRGEGNYNTGLIPDSQIDEFSENLLPFGDANDPLIKNALAQIAGLIPKKTGQRQVKVFFDSRDVMDRSASTVRIMQR